MAVEELRGTPGMGGLYVRALAGALPLPGSGGDELPDRELRLNEVSVDHDNLAEYDRVCGFRLGDTLPPTYPHLFAFPLQMRIMTDRSFPFGVLGLVHVANRIEQRRPVRADEALSLRVRAEDLRDHPKGRQFDLVTEAEAGGEPVWRSTSTYLHRGGGSDSGNGDASGEDPADEGAHAAAPSAVWPVPGDIGRRYASVSGDVNPIHLHPLTARLFGFPKQIAHGMWSKARCLAAFEGRLPDRFEVDVRFKKPVLLPAKVAFRADRAGEGWSFDLRDPKKDAPHLTGTIRPA